MMALGLFSNAKQKNAMEKNKEITSLAVVCTQ